MTCAALPVFVNIIKWQRDRRRESGRYFDGRLPLMFMRNSIKLLGSFGALKELLLLFLTAEAAAV